MEPAPDRFAYYPGTEELAAEEIRVIACGTGMPVARRGQAANCFLIELGNGDKFLFDIGTGSMANIASLMIPYRYLDKVFLSHLHTDRMGDILGLWAGGWTAGRPNALQVWSPSGRTPEMGTAYAMEHLLKFVNWDKVTGEAEITPIAGRIETTEFDYDVPDRIVYQENGVTIRSYPAIHAGDGPVSFIVEYAGLKLAFGGDMSPNRRFVEYSKDADFVIHKAFANPVRYTELLGQLPQLSWRMCCKFHTSGQAFGKIMSEIEPRHAVAYRTYEELLPSVQAGIGETYDGPLSLATDMMVWNIGKDGIAERMAVSPDRAWAVSGATQQPPPDKDRPDVMSDFIREGEWPPAFNAQNPMLDEYSEAFDVQDRDWRPAKSWYQPAK